MLVCIFSHFWKRVFGTGTDSVPVRNRLGSGQEPKEPEPNKPICQEPEPEPNRPVLQEPEPEPEPNKPKFRNRHIPSIWY